MVNKIMDTVLTGVMKTKKGSSAVMLAIIFTGFVLCMTGAIAVSRLLVASSECDVFGSLWTKAILSEYDIHLLEDYSIMAYFGNDDAVTEKLNTYLDYSAQGKLDASIKGANADLSGYELGDPANFKKALKLGFAGSAASELINGSGRTVRNTNEDDSESKGRVISNPVVIDTLPSNSISGTVSGEDLTEKAKSAGDENSLGGIISGAGTEVLLLLKSFDNHVTCSDNKEHFFENEWEYVIAGKLDDDENYSSCRNKLFIARNALNLLALYMDAEKVELITTVAEMITPGPLGLATQLILAEAWAAIETEKDLDDLCSGKRVPVIKTAGQWKTDLDSVLDSSEVSEQLDEESKELLDQNREELSGLDGMLNTVEEFKEGLNYDEYLMLMIVSLNDNVRLLRIMDLVQINMKYRYYKDFNLMEYYTGTRFTIEVNGKSHEFEDEYK